MSTICYNKKKSDCKSSCGWVKGTGCKRKTAKRSSELLSSMNSFGGSMKANSIINSNPKILDVVEDKVSDFVNTQKKLKLKPVVLKGIKTLVGVSILAATTYAFQQNVFDISVFKDVYQATAEKLYPQVLFDILPKVKGQFTTVAPVLADAIGSGLLALQATGAVVKQLFRDKKVKKGAGQFQQYNPINSNQYLKYILKN
jgi:hypothetical protein